MPFGDGCSFSLPDLGLRIMDQPLVFEIEYHWEGYESWRVSSYIIDDKLDLRGSRQVEVTVTYPKEIGHPGTPCNFSSVEVDTRTFMVDILDEMQQGKMAIVTLFLHQKSHEVERFYRYYKTQGVDQFYFYYNGVLGRGLENRFTAPDLYYFDWDYVYERKEIPDNPVFAQMAELSVANTRLLPLSEFTLFVDMDEYATVDRGATRIYDHAKEEMVGNTTILCFCNHWAILQSQDSANVTFKVAPKRTEPACSGRAKCMYSDGFKGYVDIHGVKLHGTPVTNLKANVGKGFKLPNLEEHLQSRETEWFTGKDKFSDRRILLHDGLARKGEDLFYRYGDGTTGTTHEVWTIDLFQGPEAEEQY